jgi:hypothetical protein
LLLNLEENAIKATSLWKHYALIVHAINLKEGLVCDGFEEDDAVSEEHVVQLSKEFMDEVLF